MIPSTRIDVKNFYYKGRGSWGVELWDGKAGLGGASEGLGRWVGEEGGGAGV